MILSGIVRRELETPSVVKRDSDIGTATILLVCCVVLLTGLSACSRHEHSYAEADCVNPAVCSKCGETLGDALGHTTIVGVCGRCGEVQNKGVVESLNMDFARIMDAGNELIASMADISALDLDERYTRFQEADQYVEAMHDLYGDAINLCSTEGALDGLSYQLALLRNACPGRLVGADSASLANQAVLYQLYFQQICSSFSYLSEYMDWLAGTRDMPSGEAYYEEAPRMPTPDSVIYGITYDSEKTDSGVKQYMYLIGDNESDANMNYNIYLSAVSSCDGLEVEITDTYAYVTENGMMMSAMMAGTDASMGYFLIVSFQE